MSPIADARSDDELLVAAAGGDADAFARFYERHIALVLSVLAQRTGSGGLAASLAGETFAGSPDGLPAISARRPSRCGLAVGDRAEQAA